MTSPLSNSASTAPAPKGGPGVGVMAGQLTVLLADADPAARHVLRRVLLREFKSVVIEADNGIAALEALDSGEIDAVVIDLKIPVLSGMEVLRDIRTSPNHRAMPVVVVTETKDETTIKEAITLGVADYVLKDQHQAVIVERLRRVFSSERHVGHAHVASQAGNWAKALSTAFTILVVDEDPDFRHFCADIFRSQYEVTTTQSAAQALAMSMSQAPNAILVGSSVGTMSQASFAQRVRRIERLSASRLVAVVPKPDVKRVTDSGLFDRVAVRTFVPEQFLRQFEQFLKPPGVLAKVAMAIPGFRTQTISAVEQVFGMMLGTEVNILPAPPSAPSQGLSVAIPISLTEQNTDMIVAANVSESTGVELAARMLQSPPSELPSDAASSALSEILNMVGGRVQHALTNHGLSAHLGLPAVGKVGDPPSEAIVLGFAFESLTGEPQHFAFYVCEKETAAA